MAKDFDVLSHFASALVDNLDGTFSLRVTGLEEALAHAALSDMPDGTGVVTDHDTRLVPKVQDATPTTPTPFTGMLWYDTDATGSAVSSTVNIVTKTATYTIVADDVIIFCDGTFTVTLPTAVGISGKKYVIKNIGSGSITVDGDGAETIDGSANQVLAQNESIEVASDNVEWWIL